jgi:hypothetical protein
LSPPEPPDRFLAVPGHVIDIDREGGGVTVACGSGWLQLQEIESQGDVLRPAELIRSIRLRFK